MKSLFKNKFRNTILVISLFLVCISCEPGKISSSKDIAEKTLFPFNTHKASEKISLDHVRSQFRKLIVDRQTSMKEDLFDLTYYYLTPQYFSNMAKIDPNIDFEGFWLKFDNNYKFQYGINERVVGTGMYHYAGSTQLLLMLDDDERIEPKMFTVLSNSEFINMMGRPIFLIRGHNGKEFIILERFAQDAYIDQAGDKIAEIHNGMQIKMILAEDRPMISNK